MAAMSITSRKLTTVFSADVHGYSRLMEVDEEGTFATLKTYRDAMARLIGSRGGRVVNTWGDGLIAEFPSVVEAVRAAVDVQNELAGQNAGRTDGRQMLYRVGINLGDVIVDGDDIYGDGVNIAARLQGEAPPGGILISQTVYDQVRNKLSVGFEFLGNLSVKNLDENVPSYAVRIGEAKDRAAPTGQRAQASRPSEPSSQGAPVRLAQAGVADLLANRKLGFLALTGAALVAINLFSSPGQFWARWPLLVLAVIAGSIWARRTTRLDRGLAVLLVAGLGIAAINLLSWQGEFWARWPLLAVALVAGIRWLRRRGK
jgi:adenylate cyclase